MGVHFIRSLRGKKVMENPPGFPAAVFRESLDAWDTRANGSTVPCHFHTMVLSGGLKGKGVPF